MSISYAIMSYRIFSPGQTVAIVFAALLLAGLIGLNIWFGYLLHKRVEHRLQDDRLQKQRDELMRRLSAMRSGEVTEFPENRIALKIDDDIDKAEDEQETDAIEELEEEMEEAEPLDLEVTESGEVVRYNRSFTARIIQSDNDLKARYSELKNYILSYKSIKSRMSWKKETFHIGRKSVASFTVRGKTLCLNLATDAKLFDNTKYKVDDMSGGGVRKNPMPCRYKITSDRKTGYAKEMIDIVAVGFGVARLPEYTARDFTLPYKSTEALVKRRLIKISGKGIPDYERDDALAAAKRMRYNRSFEARIIQADDSLKGYYSKLKNHLLSYEGVTANPSWKKESYIVGRDTVANFIVRGKTLCLCLALDPKRFDGTKYKVEDRSLRVKKTVTPTLFRVRSARGLNYAMQLIDKLFEVKGVAAKAEKQSVNYAVPFTATETLVRRGLIKVVKLKPASEQADSEPMPTEHSARHGEDVPPEENIVSSEAEAAATETVDTAATETTEAQADTATTETPETDNKDDNKE